MEAFLQTHHVWRAIDAMKTGGGDSGLNLTRGRFRQLHKGVLSTICARTSDSRRMSVRWFAPISTISSLATDPAGATSARTASDFVVSRSMRRSRATKSVSTIYWLEDDALDDLDLLPLPDEVAAEIVESLETALASFRRVSRPLSR
ncbi:hypothetical protein [Methylocapsa aurea]|uniref:hypothetical protein n=1 Tax=Methylocapsa aurea TaxID=663610 RepID=UPI003D18E2C8